MASLEAVPHDSDTAIQGSLPLKTSIAFLFLTGTALALPPRTARLLECSTRHRRWALGAC